MEYENKSNTELMNIMNDLSSEYDKIKLDVEKLLEVADDIELRYKYIEDLIKKRVKK